MPTLGRLIEFDERSRDYPIRLLLPRKVPTTKLWPCDVVLDQGSIGACVGFSWAAELAAEPVPVEDITNVAGMSIYNQAQLLDQWDDTPPMEGTSVLAGAKAVMNMKQLFEYRWAFGINDVLETLSSIGPGILGINWYDSMFDINDHGYLDVSGSIAGGHAILVRGVNMEEGFVLLHNSWGRSWGMDGTAKLTFASLDRLLREDGEFCVPLVRAQIPPYPPEPEPVGCLPLTRALDKLDRWLKRE